MPKHFHSTCNGQIVTDHVQCASWHSRWKADNAVRKDLAPCHGVYRSVVLLPRSYGGRYNKQHYTTGEEISKITHINNSYKKDGSRFLFTDPCAICFALFNLVLSRFSSYGLSASPWLCSIFIASKPASTCAMSLYRSIFFEIKWNKNIRHSDITHWSPQSPNQSLSVMKNDPSQSNQCLLFVQNRRQYASHTQLLTRFHWFICFCV